MKSFAVVLVLLAAPPPPGPAARLLELKGAVEVRVAGARKPRPAVVNDLVRPGDHLLVPKAGQATVVFLGSGVREVIIPGREVTVEAERCTPADAVVRALKRVRPTPTAATNARPVDLGLPGVNPFLQGVAPGSYPPTAFGSGPAARPQGRAGDSPAYGYPVPARPFPWTKPAVPAVWAIPAPPRVAAISIVNRVSPSAPVTYSVDGRRLTTTSGDAQILDVNPVSTIVFDRGGTLGAARYSLSSGAYEFRSTAKGLDLFRTVPSRSQAGNGLDSFGAGPVRSPAVPFNAPLTVP